MKAADYGATHIALALLNAGAKTDLQDKVEILVHLIWNILLMQGIRKD